MSIVQLFGPKHQIPSCNIQTNSKHTNPNDSFRERSRENWSLGFGISRGGLQSYRVSCFEAPWQPIGGLPARSPAVARVVPWRGIESQPCYSGERVALSRIHCYPFAPAAFTITAELG